jgi:hypothetical protein
MRLVSITWIDSFCSPDWDNAQPDEHFKIRSFGILVREGKKSVTISTSQSGNGKFMDQLTIPLCAIQKMKRVKWKK